MLDVISEEIRKSIRSFPQEDELLFQDKAIRLNKEKFFPINFPAEDKTIAYVDGGQAEILSAGNFCLSFVRIFAQIFRKNVKIQSYKNEFYLFTKSAWKEEELFYESKIFSLTEKLVNEQDLLISSFDATIRSGRERAAVTKVSPIARRFAELAIASQIEADFVVIDGTLQSTFLNEEKYIQKLNDNVCSLAKTSCLFTRSGNNPAALLQKWGKEGRWYFPVHESENFADKSVKEIVASAEETEVKPAGKNTFFVKLHPQARHVFRFEGNKEILPLLAENSNDVLFLGYPYGLIFADKMARVSNEEQKSLFFLFASRKENKEIMDYLHSCDAHQILDRIG